MVPTIGKQEEGPAPGPNTKWDLPSSNYTPKKLVLDVSSTTKGRVVLDLCSTWSLQLMPGDAPIKVSTGVWGPLPPWYSDSSFGMIRIKCKRSGC